MTPIIPDPPVAAYTRYYRPGAVLLASKTLGAEPVFALPGIPHLLRSVLREVQAALPFRVDGWAILPDEVAFLLCPGPGVSAEQILRRVRHRFQQAYPEVRGLPEPIALWARSRRIQPLPGVEAFAHCLDSLHYSPVARGLCPRPEDWPESSYSGWIERGLYKLGWGWSPPERLQMSGR